MSAGRSAAKISPMKRSSLELSKSKNWAKAVQ
jgi:hypothetical protein